MKALDLMKTNQSVQERAVEFAKSIKRNIQKEILDELTAKIESLSDREFELSNFVLGTDVNAGAIQMTRQDCEDRFKELIDIAYQKKLLMLELNEKQAAFDNYFKDAEITG